MKDLRQLLILAEELVSEIKGYISNEEEPDGSLKNVTDDYWQVTDDGKLKTSELLAKCKEKFAVYCFWNDKDLNRNFPPPVELTTRYFKKNVEADKEHTNKSANDLDKLGVKGITLRERLILESQYFHETGKHLDIGNVTLCAGSRGFDGGVPGVDWGTASRGLCVHWCSPDDRNARLRARAAVSLDTFYKTNTYHSSPSPSQCPTCKQYLGRDTVC